MKNRLSLPAMAFALMQGGIGGVPMQAQITVHTIGDSTMANQPENGEIRGWGQMFQQFFDENQVLVNNRGKSGASSKSFYLEPAYWNSVKTQIKPGDYVIIQFAHNDEKNGGMDGDELKALYTAAGKTAEAAAIDYRGTTASGTYKEYLRNYVRETRELGAVPVLATAICRNYWNGSSIRQNGAHNLGESFDRWDVASATVVKSSVAANDFTYSYPHATEAIAQELSVPLLDITEITKKLYESYGQINCSKQIFTANDGTHPSALGATLIARLAAREMKSKGMLVDAIQSDADLLINPVALDMETAYIGQSVTKTITVSGFDFSEPAGHVVVSATNGVELSESRDGAYASTLLLPYSDGNLSCATVYVRYKFTIPGVLNSSITITAGEKSKSIPVTANCIEVAEGSEVLLSWNLNDDAEHHLDGPATPVVQSWSQMVVQRYASPNTNTVWPVDAPFQNGEKTQRNYIDNEGGVWPDDEIDEVSTRYIQFGIRANEGTVLNIDSIGLYVCGSGGNGMRCKVYYLSESGQGTLIPAADGTNLAAGMVANTMYEVSCRPVVALQGGESLYLRIYPWYNGGSTGKTICLSHVTIRGIASALSSVGQTETDSNVVATEYRSVSGIRYATPFRGINIVTKQLSDGRILTEKVVL